MLTSGDLVELDLGIPAGREARFAHPAIVITAQRILDASPAVIQIVPLTSTQRGFGTEHVIEPDSGNGLKLTSAAQCQHIRAVSTERVGSTIGNVGPVHMAQIRDLLSIILDLDR